MVPPPASAFVDPGRHGHGRSFPRHCRLKSNAAIRDIIQHPSGRGRWHAFRVSWAQDPSDAQSSPARFAFVVSRRSGPAHQRNRIKRRLREAIRRHKDLWPAGTSVIIRADGDRAARMTFAALSRQVREVLARIGRELK